MRDEMTKVQNKSYFNGWLTKLCEEFSEVPSGDKTTIRRTQIMDLINGTVNLIKDERENPEIYKDLYKDENANINNEVKPLINEKNSSCNKTDKHFIYNDKYYYLLKNNKIFLSDFTIKHGEVLDILEDCKSRPMYCRFYTNAEINNDFNFKNNIYQFLSSKLKSKISSLFYIGTFNGYPDYFKDYTTEITHAFIYSLNGMLGVTFVTEYKVYKEVRYTAEYFNIGSVICFVKGDGVREILSDVCKSMITDNIFRDEKYMLNQNNIIYHNYAYDTILSRDEIIMNPVRIGLIRYDWEYQYTRVSCSKKDYRKVFDAYKSQTHQECIMKLVNVINNSDIFKNKKHTIVKVFYLGSMKGEFNGLKYKDNEDTIVSHMLLIKFTDIVDNVIVVEENIKNKEMDVKVYAEDGYFSGYLDSSTDSELFRSLVLDIFCKSF